MLKQALRGRPLRVVMAVITVSTALVVGSFGAADIGAAPVSKTLTGTCSGADPDSVGLLNVLGGNLTLPFDIESDVPATLQPEQSGSAIAFTWKLTLATDVVNKAVGIDQALTVSNLVVDMGVKGPTTTTEVQGRPAPIDLVLVKDQPSSISLGPFGGTLEGVGKGGVIRYSPSKISFTISVDLPGQGAKNINVNCSASGVAATTSIKIPGSPDITQPISVEGQPGQTVTVDVLGQYVTPGVDEKGQTRPVDPTSLKVVDGPATVTPDGKLAITAGATGTTTSATFEVCSGTLPGVDEVQRLTIEPPQLPLRRTVGFTVKYGDAETDPIWMTRKFPSFPEPGWNPIYEIYNAWYLSEAQRFHPELTSYPEVYPKPVDWRGESFGFFWTDAFAPTPELIQPALEKLPGIGVGGVKVSAVEGEPYSFDVTFIGPNKEKDVPQLAVGSSYTILPRETLDLILEQAQGLLNGPKPEIPAEFPDVKAYAAALQAQIKAAMDAGDMGAALDATVKLIGILPSVVLADFDPQPLINAITGIFPVAPSVTTTVSGEDPTPICSQGVVDVTVANVTVAGAVATPVSATNDAAVAAVIRFAG